MNSRYLPKLTQDHHVQHVEDSHSFWGRGGTIEDRIRLLRTRLVVYGPKIYTMAGLADSDGKLLASLKRYYFKIVVNDDDCPCVGLGAVFTHPDFRRKGYAAELIRIAVEDAKSTEGCKYAMLYSDIAPAYYERFGFQQLPALNWQSGLVESDTSTPLSFRKAKAIELEQMLELFSAHAKRAKAYGARDQQTWGLFREINSIGNDYVVEGQGGIVGYFTATPVKDKRYLWVEECVAPESIDLWPIISDFARSQGLHELRGWDSHLSVRPAESKTLKREKQIPMILFIEKPGSIPEGVLSQAHFTPADHF
jgi:GNAT superfamily N-acetyltransferase